MAPRLYTLYTFAVATLSFSASLARAEVALERGLGDEAVSVLTPVFRSASLAREHQVLVRTALTEAWLLQDDLVQAAAVLGRPPDPFKDQLGDAALANLWRLHGRLAFARGEHSRSIALHSRALKHAELAHASRAIGLAHYELAVCYKQVGDSGIVRDHLTEAASALHAAGDKRHLALVHSLSGVLLAQAGRLQDAMAAMQQGERLATAAQANDVLSSIVHNQANVALIRHQPDQALELAKRSLALREGLGPGHGLAVALATLGQIHVQLGDLERAEEALTRALETRSAVRFSETTGAVFDTLAQIHLMRGGYERAEEYLRQAGEAYGAYGTQTMRWYEWSLRVLEVRLAIRRGDFEGAVTKADELLATAGIPPADAVHTNLAACEALVSAGHIERAAERLDECEARLDPRLSPAAWGEFLRVRGTIHERRQQPSAAYHDFAQSVSVFDLVGERYQAALSQFALGRLAAGTGSQASAEQYFDRAASVFESLGARTDRDAVGAAKAQLSLLASPVTTTPSFQDEAAIRRLVDATVMPELLARETASALLELTEGRASVVFLTPSGNDPHILATAGCDEEGGRRIASAALQGARTYLDGALMVESLGRDASGARSCAIVTPTQLAETAAYRFRMFATVARQGFDVCALRERPLRPLEPVHERSLEPLFPGFVCASPAMSRVAEQIQRLQAHTLTVLITGESGTGKDLVARAIHGGSPRRAASFLPYNCTTTTRELADSQLFGHRRGSFTGAVSDQQGLIRAAEGGTLFFDEIGDLPLDVQPKLLRFLEQGEIMPVGETRPRAVDVRVLAATNADLEQRVAEGTFREDLYYRLSVIRIHVPPLKERREEIPHLVTYFLRDACERLGKADVQLSSTALEVLTRYWWPGNVRQLRNEIQRAVALSPPGGTVTPDHLSPDLVAPARASTEAAAGMSIPVGNLAARIEEVERQVITAALRQTSGNISETARLLGLTRRGLYLKMNRLRVDSPMAIQ